MVTRKAFVRSILQRVPQFRRRSKTSATNCVRRCSVLRMKDNSAAGAGVGPHHRVTKTRAKSAGRTKMTRSLSDTMDVGRNFGTSAGAMAAVERSGAADGVRIALFDSRRPSGCP